MSRFVSSVNLYLLLLILGAGVSLISCNGQATRIDDLEKDVDRLKGQVAGLADKFKWLSESTPDVYKKLSERIAGLESELAIIKTELTKVMSQPITTPNTDTEKKVKEVLGKVKKGELTPTAGAIELRGLGDSIIPVLISGLKTAKSVKDFEYVDKIEDLLSGLPTELLVTHIPSTLKDEQTRSSIVRIIGNTGNKELSKSLEAYASEPDKDLRFLVGEAMVKCKNKGGIPILIEALRYDKEGYNIVAYDLLNKATKLSFDYKMYLSAKENEGAIKKWEEWWTGSGGTFEFK